jgi:hypothetical protein
MRRYVLAGVVGVALTFGVTACGGESDNEKIESVVKQFFTGIAEGDGEKACDALAGPYQREILSDDAEGSCSERLSQVAENSGDEEKDAFTSVEVTDIEKRGEGKALAKTKSDKPSEGFDNVGAYNMRKFGDDWKIASNDQIEGAE